MEEDYKIFTEEELKGIKKYNIEYKWRDSCVNELINYHHCKEFHPYTQSINCGGYRKTWEDCQFERERKIISTVLKPVPMERRKLSS